MRQTVYRALVLALLAANAAAFTVVALTKTVLSGP